MSCNAQSIIQGEYAAVQTAQAPAAEESAAEGSAAPAAAPEQMSAASDGGKKGWQLSPEGDAAILHGKPQSKWCWEHVQVHWQCHHARPSSESISIGHSMHGVLSRPYQQDAEGLYEMQNDLRNVLCCLENGTATCA